ncbi:MAG TPA: organic hydroperoxide resistance protein [Kofleriaceae bacterium]|jgi:Ohr subfamily peroxiredoxin|nr:organic hydroperoxide resistance protein [Kofleriaceae bacterium]
MSNSPAILEKRLYTATATSTGGRDGRAKSDDGTLDLAISPPGGNKPGTNPEQLFAAGYSACFGSAIGAVSRIQKITPGNFTVTAKVTLGTVGQGYGIAADLEVSMPDLPRDQAEALVAAAHQVCPYSNATRGNIEVNVKVV